MPAPRWVLDFNAHVRLVRVGQIVSPALCLCHLLSCGGRCFSHFSGSSAHAASPCLEHGGTQHDGNMKSPLLGLFICSSEMEGMVVEHCVPDKSQQENKVQLFLKGGKTSQPPQHRRLCCLKQFL